MKIRAFLYAGAIIASIVLAMHVGILVQPESVPAQSQEPKKIQYSIVEVTTDTPSMQRTLNEYGAAGWELVAVGLGDLTSPRLIFKR